jgi:hypothetical protein
MLTARSEKVLCGKFQATFHNQHTKNVKTLPPYSSTIMKRSIEESAIEKRLHADFRSNALPIATEEAGFLSERCSPA